MAVPFEASEVQTFNLVGSGAFSNVYKAVLRGKVIALKKFRDGLPPRAFEDVQREIQIGGHAEHENLIRLFAYCFNPLQLALEYFPSTNLNMFIFTGDYTWGTMRFIALQLARALAHLHRFDVIHRDIKSPNVLVASDGSFRVKLCDYGSSRVKTATLVHTGKRGTVTWSAPEMLFSTEYGPAVDIYSFGIVLVELAARRDPWPNMNDFSIEIAVQRGVRPSLPPTVPPALVARIRDCLATSPAERPTAQQLVEFFEAGAGIPPEMMSAVVPLGAV